MSLQREIGRQVRLKRTPLLVFKSDPAVVAGFQVEEVLRRLRDMEGGDEPPGDDAR